MPKIKVELGRMTPAACEGLPDTVTESISSITDARVVVYGSPGWGKTELFMSNPKCLLLACEEGHKFTRGYKLIIDAWDGVLNNGGRDPYKDTKGNIHTSFVRAVANLQKPEAGKLYNFIFIDTMDSLVKLLLDFTLGKNHVQHASQLGEYGVGYDLAQNAPFRKTFGKLLKTPFGIGVSTHEQVENKNFKNKGTFARKETTLPGGIYKQVFAQFDLILHGTYGKIQRGNTTRDRILESEGSEDILAKNRGGIVPPAFIVPRDIKQRWKMFEEFFTNPKSVITAYDAYKKAGYSLD